MTPLKAYTVRNDIETHFDGVERMTSNHGANPTKSTRQKIFNRTRAFRHRDSCFCSLSFVRGAFRLID